MATLSSQVLTLNDNSGRDAEYHHHGNSESLRLHTSARPKRREFYVDKDGNEIGMPYKDNNEMKHHNFAYMLEILILFMWNSSVLVW